MGFKKTKGFTHAGGLLDRTVREGTQKRGFSETMILTRWEEVVGADIAAISQPSTVRFSKGGLGATLVVLTNGARAPEVQMKLPLIRERVNACYGYNAITKVVITQTDAASPGFSEQQATFTPAKPMRDDAGDVFNLEDVKDAGLRDALDFIGNHVLTKKN